MRFILVFAIYVLENWKLSATPRNGFVTPLGVATHRLGTTELGQQKGIGPALETRQSNTIKYGVNQIIPERY